MNQIEVNKDLSSGELRGQCHQSRLSLRGKEEGQALPQGDPESVWQVR